MSPREKGQTGDRAEGNLVQASAGHWLSPRELRPRETEREEKRSCRRCLPTWHDPIWLLHLTPSLWLLGRAQAGEGHRGRYQEPRRSREAGPKGLYPGDISQVEATVGVRDVPKSYRNNQKSEARRA